MWFRAACLLASVGLHAGLGAVGWQSFGTAPVDSGPMLVTLADRPDLEPVSSSGAKPKSSPTRHVRSVSAGATRRQNQASAAVVASLRSHESQTVASLCTAPETTIIETVMATAPPETDSNGEVLGDGMPADGAQNGGRGPVVGLPVGGGDGDDGGNGGAPRGVILATPRYASNPKPEYPRLARQNRWEGIVYVRAAISAAGEVESVMVENSSGHQVLDFSALRGVRRWQFIPARRGDAQIPCEVRIPVAFKLDR